MSELRGHFGGQQAGMVALLQELVAIESPSSDKEAVDRVGRRVAQLMQAAGAAVERFPRREVGDPILGRFALPGQPASAEQEKPVLLLCHMDTVWPLGTLADRPQRLEDGRLYGPGAYDMKGGIVIALTALQGLRALDRPPSAPVWLLCTGDEETGSLGSSDLIRELAAGCSLVLCLEPCLPGGALKTARKGVGQYLVRAVGRAAHAGANHERGVNAIAEIAHHVLAFQELTDYARGTTVNVGVVRGGTAGNVVPAAAEIEVDFRVTVPQEANRLVAAIEGARPYLPGAELQIAGGLNRPPMVRDELMASAFRRACAVAARHGFELQEGSTGGASDANFTAPLGVPTLDGLGPDGDGAHAATEHVLIESLPRQATLVAALLSEWHSTRV